MRAGRSHHPGTPSDHRVSSFRRRYHGAVDSLTVQIIVTVLAALAYCVGLAGIVVPILPGTITIVIATLIWAIVMGSAPGWICFGIVLILGIAGMAANYFITGRSLKKHEVPTWPILVALASGIVGIFVIPFLGLIIGFLLGLYVAESIRQQDWSGGLKTSWVAIKALGIGFAVELVLALGSTLTFAIAIVAHFVIR